MINDDITMGDDSGGSSGGTSPARSYKISTVERLMKKTSWVWGGNMSSDEITNTFGDYTRCPKRSTILSTTYNKRSVASITLSTDNNKLLMLDDIKQTTKPTLEVGFKANSSLNTYVANFTFDLFLSNSETSTTNVRNLAWNKAIENVNKGGVESYNFNITLADLNTWENPFSRDAYVCCKITSNWTYNRAIYFSVLDSNDNVVVNETYITTSKTGCTGNFKITFRELIANNYKLRVEFKTS